MVSKNTSSSKDYILVVCPNPSVDIYAYIDDFEVGSPNRIRAEKSFPGGKGLHVAMALAELGHRVKISGFWGGYAGAWIKSESKKRYPLLEFYGPELHELTRSCYTFKSRGHFDDTEILGPGPKISNKEYEALLHISQKLAQQASMAVMSGSWPSGSPEDGYAKMNRAFKKNNLSSFVDCTGMQLKNVLATKPFGIHLNKKEITTFFDSDFETAKRRILDYCEIAAITDGAKGLYYLTRTQENHALCEIEKVVSTIGAGDCLTAGVISGLVRGMDAKSTAQLGAACGAANCMRPDLGMLYKHDVDNLLNLSLIRK